MCYMAGIVINKLEGEFVADGQLEYLVLVVCVAILVDVGQTEVVT